MPSRAGRISIQTWRSPRWWAPRSWATYLKAAVFAGCVGVVACGLAGEPADERDAGESKRSAESTAKGTPFSQEAVQYFEREVQPIFEQHCLKCHGATKPKAGLSLTSREAVLTGGDSGAAIVPGKPNESLLLEAMRYDGYEMPPKGKLPDELIARVTRWVEMNAPWTPGKPKVVVRDEHSPPEVNEESRRFWSFQPVERPEPPETANENGAEEDWIRSPIDAFVWRRLKSAGLHPAAPAGKLAWLRRAYYDLIGLPPSPKAVRQFLADDSPNAFEAVVDRLLDSPQYGEKWGRHWLDLVRYAETNSYERDGAKPFVWKYRDYVVDSFNSDKPYDQFLLEQLAGDELDNPSAESVIATGYYRLGIWDDEPADPEQALYDDLDDILTTTSQVMLGLTINCGRCHDHKIDPIPQRDYYRMLAFFRGLNRFGVRSAESVAQFSLREVASDVDHRRHDAEVQLHQRKLNELAEQIAELEKPVRADFSPVEKEEFRHEMNRLPIVRKRVGKLLTKAQFVEYRKLTKERKALEAHPPSSQQKALCVTEIGAKSRDCWVLIRGNPQAKGDPVKPGFPSVLGFDDPVISPASADAKTSGRRLVLAKWIVSKRNPLTARVMANRLWQYHFGRGLVRSSNDFGFQGDRPTHPRLLDWLAAELTDGDWRLKRMHKLIMLSSTYRMSTMVDEKAFAKDPGNDLLWRFDPRRLTAEEIRDSILAVNGSLNLEQGGPSIYPLIPAAVLAGQSRPGAGWGTSTPEERNRRSIYIHVKRSLMTPILASFDEPDGDVTCPVRFTSTQPTQALGMLNSEFANRQAQVFVDDLVRRYGDKQSTLVQTALFRVLQRPPTQAEVDRGVAFIRELQSEDQVSAEVALRLFCVMALNLNEFVYLD